MEKRKLKVMLIEDNPGDARFVQEELSEASSDESVYVDFDLRWFNLLSTGLSYLSRGGFDTVLLDMNLPDGEGLDNIDKIRSVSDQVPIVILSGLKDEIRIAEAIRRGAQHYVVKGELSGSQIAQVIFNAIEQKQKETAL